MTEERQLSSEKLASADMLKPDDTGGGGRGGIAKKANSMSRKNDANASKYLAINNNINLRHKKTYAQCVKATVLAPNSDSEEGFLSTSPDSTNGEATNNALSATTDGVGVAAAPLPPPICLCTNPSNCVTIKNILDSFKAPISEEQAWALIYQFMAFYRKIATVSGVRHIFTALEIPDTTENMCLHRDGSVHCAWSDADLKEKELKVLEEKQQQKERGDDEQTLQIASHKQVLKSVAVIVYSALDYNLQADEQCQMSQELEELITYMTSDESNDEDEDDENDDVDDDCIDEGIDEGYKRWSYYNDDERCNNETKDFDAVLEACKNHIKPTVPEDHYRAVCRALVTETIELRIFLQQVLNDDADTLHKNADSQTSKQELAKLGFNDWARFWVQVVDELRRGVRLKKKTYERAPIEYELTPYEILMEDIRSKKYQLRKVMVDGDIPPRVKKDAHAVILEFIRSRPPLKKASERKLPPPIKRTPSPREQLMDSIRKGQTLKHIQPPMPARLKDRLLPPAAASTSTNATLDSLRLQENMEAHTTPRSKQRLIKVDFSLLRDDDTFFDESNSGHMATAHVGVCSQPKMPPYPIGGYMISESTTATAAAAATTAKAPGNAHMPAPLTTRVMRRTTYDLATQCESRRASLRRHTIVGCQSNFDETHSMPPSRPESRQSEVNTNAAGNDGVSATRQLHNNNNSNQLAQQQQQQQHFYKRSQSPNPSVGNGSSSGSINCSRSSSSVGPWSKSFLDEKTWHERGDDRLSLTLEEIVHIRSVMTKAELEGLPVGVRVKEDVEKRKVCFLCLRTRFSIFGPWGIQCKLCQRTVCSKCYTKMRIPTEHFRNVPLVLISPSLLASPAGSSTPSPSHHAHQHATHSSSTGNILDETFPKSLIERLLRSESERKTRNTVGSAPSSPKHQRSNMSTPGIIATTTTTAAAAAGQAVEALHDVNNSMTTSYTAGTTNNTHNTASCYGAQASHMAPAHAQANNKHISIMSRSMEGPRSLPANSPARTYSNSSTLDRKSKFSRAFTLSSSGTHLSQEQKENMRGEQVPVCNDCKGLVMEITRSSKQTRSSARNRALQNLTLDLSPVYK